MAVIPRKVGEAIRVGRELTVRLVSVDPGAARFDIVGRRRGGPRDGEGFFETVLLADEPGAGFDLDGDVRVELVDAVDGQLRIRVDAPAGVDVGPALELPGAAGDELD